MTLRADATPCSLSFAPDGSTLACGYANGSVQLWDPRSGELMRRWRPPARVPPVVRVLFAPDGQHVVTMGGENGIDVWDYSGRHIRELYPHTGSGQLRSCVFPSAARLVISWQRCVHDGMELPTFNTRDWTPVASQYRLPPERYAPGRLAAEPGGTRIATDYGDVFDMTPGRPAVHFAGGYKSLAVSWCPGRDAIALIDDWRNVLVFDATTGAEIVKLAGAKSRINAVAFMPDGSVMLTSGNRGVVTFTDTATWRERQALDFGLGAVHEIAVSPDGLTVAAICGRGNERLVVIWDLQ